MSSELLREAAALMRDRAEAATPGPWEPMTADSGLSYRALNAWVVTEREGDHIADVDYDGDAEGRHAMEGADASHIASWHPVVALAVADWLDGVAHFIECKDDEEYFDLDGDPIAAEDTHAIGSALDVANAYLGRES